MKKLAVPNFPESVCFFSSGNEPISAEWKSRSFPYSPKRKHELLLGRHLLRHAVIALGEPDPGWIDSDENRIPKWPSGIQGSLSHHTDSHAIVWAHRGSEALGVDLQPWLSNEQAENLRGMAEKRSLSLPDLQATGLTANEGMTLLFCVQESIQKCLGNRRLPSANLASIRIDRLDSHAWSAKIEEKIQIHGLWLRYEGLCVTFGAL